MDLTKRQFREIGGRVAVGNPSEFTHPGALKGALAEFISTLIFVFVGIGSAVAYDKMTGRITEKIVILPAALVAGALSHGFAMFVAVSVSVKNSGGHVNPAITFAALLGGHITLIRGLLYWVAQLLGSVAACLLLKFLANGLVVPGYGIHDVTVWNALVMEIVLTFGLVYTVYATTLDPKKGNLETIAPLSIGMIVVANTLVGGIFTGAAMNPAIAFGSAIVSWYWTGHWVYWAGPLVGSGLAAIIYHLFFISSSSSATDDVSSDY